MELYGWYFMFCVGQAFALTVLFLLFEQLPQGRSAQRLVDKTNLFPILNGTTTVPKRLHALPRRW